MSRIDLSAVRVGEFLQAPVVGPDTGITALATLSNPREGALVFAVDPVKFADEVARAAEAGAIILVPVIEGVSYDGGTFIVVDNPRAAFAAAVREFFEPRPCAGISPTAMIHESAMIDPTASVGHFSVIGAGASIGAGVEIRHHVVIGVDVVIGAKSLIKSHAVIGEEGFGVEPDAEGNNLRLPHVGSVVLGDSVEVGAFTTVCSGTIEPTTVGPFTKIDDHVHVAHNVSIGSNVIITACAEISGSVRIGDRAWVSPNASIIQGVSVGDNALIGIGAVVIRSVPASEVHFGNPAKKFRDR
ncbi:LpxD N-terminal domain-containing protein [Salinibacterium sp.]|uniref:LpxD N-terminal domain-containing protein n=1 Tax=Salinibacterium sp. TaxID=1915057 RepID=UPI002869FE15|nr:LpxD N-terminal domain-containing protein [Salinibacterium sp.]